MKRISSNSYFLLGLVSVFSYSIVSVYSSGGWGHIEEAAAYELRGGGTCYSTTDYDCGDNIEACGDKECEASPTGWTCPKDTTGAHDIQETLTSCKSDSDGGYERKEDADDPWCYKEATCKLTGCITATDLKNYCANGPNTPKKKILDEDLVFDCENDSPNRCPEGP